MGGICGIAFADTTRAVEEPRLLNMLRPIEHRGKDGKECKTVGNVGFAQCWLGTAPTESSVLPTRSGADRSTVFAFDGEIYGLSEGSRGASARGADGGETASAPILARWVVRQGARALAEVRGAFALAVWDEERRALTLIRDQSGIKPLYYSHLADGTILFASEIKAIFGSGLVEPEINREVVLEYLANGFVSGTSTLYRGIRKLAPGTALEWAQGLTRTVRYWSPAEDSECGADMRADTVEEAGREFWRRFVPIVASQYSEGVPSGVFLSGGLDSSLLVAAIRSAGGDTLKTFSVGYHEESANELPWARLVAGKLGTEHHEVLVTAREFFGSIPELTYVRDLPLSFSSAIPLYHLSRFAASQIQVVLTGEGSDELFAGYGRYPRSLMNLRWAARLDRSLPGSLRRAGIAAARRAGSGYLGSRIGRSFLAHPAGFQSSFLQPFSVFPEDLGRSLLAPGVPDTNAFGALEEILDRGLLATNPLEAMLRYDQQTYLDELLMKQDAMGAACSLTGRVPFLDLNLVNWAAALPPEVKLRRGTGKALVRAAARMRLPDEIIDESKRGFPVPLGEWMRGTGRENLHEMIPSVHDEFLSRAAVSKLVAEHEAGRDHSAKLWRLMAFQVWRRDTLPRMSDLGREARAVDAYGSGTR